MAEYEERERQFNESLPGIVGNFMTAVCLADGRARMQAVEVTRQILELPNLDIQQKIGILNREDPLVFAQSLPSVIVSEPRPFLADTVDLEMSMTVSASTMSESSKDGEREIGGSGGFKIGPFSGSMSIKANTSTHSTKKRASDYSATTDMKLHMIRHPLSEGLAKSIDAMNEIGISMAQLNIGLANREVTRIAAEEDPQLPTDVVKPEVEAGG